MRGQDQRFTLEIDFMTAARGGSTRITMPDGAVLEVKIPEGARDGQIIRLRGKGGPGMGDGEPGDALLTLIVAETLSASSGLGYMAMQAREFMVLDVVVLSILLYAALGKLADTLTRTLERRALKWSPAYANH